MHDATSLVRASSAAQSPYLDWDAQPSMVKRYPDFCVRYAFDSHPFVASLSLARRISSRRSSGGRSSLRLTVPSAGNLHPLELYVQIRGVEGIVSGIYHVSPAEEAIVLIREIGGEGIERYLGMQHRFAGAIFLISFIPFRSVWKYGARAWRYLYLDLGHQLAVLICAMDALGQSATILSSSDKCGLDRMMGFSPDETTALVVGYGQETGRPLKPEGGQGCIRVAPTDYCEESLALARVRGALASILPHLFPRPVFDDRYARLTARRSTRMFDGRPIDDAMIERLLYNIDRYRSPKIAMTAVVMQNTGRWDAGIYRDGRLIVTGCFDRRVRQIALDQPIVGSAAFALFFHAADPDGEAYSVAGHIAGLLAYECQAGGIGFSGIGAYYDDEAATFLSTRDAVVYLAVMGGER